jgi:hypothetical protein
MRYDWGYFDGAILAIKNNDALIDLSALENLTLVETHWVNDPGGLFIEDNDALTTLTGLDNIDGRSLAFLSIVNNSSLTTCHVHSVCDHLALIFIDTEIHDNATGCDSEEEVMEACMYLAIPELGIVPDIIMYPNPVSNELHFSLPDGTEIEEIFILDITGQRMIHTKDVTNVNVSTLKSGIYFCVLKTDFGTTTMKMIKME